MSLTMRGISNASLRGQPCKTLAFEALLVILLAACSQPITKEQIQSANPASLTREKALDLCYASANLCSDAPGIVAEFQKVCITLYAYGSVESIVKQAKTMCSTVQQ